jgi:c-di-GMP-binding flagellar brake protein YcgR
MLEETNMTSSSGQERRRFSRIEIPARAHIKTASGDLHPNSHVIDISLHGLLTEEPDNWTAKMGTECHIDLMMGNDQIVIQVEGQVAHIDENHIGFSFDKIDIDSISHLKRLVALHIGDETILHRELSALIDAE